MTTYPQESSQGMTISYQKTEKPHDVMGILPAYSGRW